MSASRNAPDPKLNAIRAYIEARGGGAPSWDALDEVVETEKRLAAQQPVIDAARQIATGGASDIWEQVHELCEALRTLGVPAAPPEEPP